jgi:hypothetical protein
VKQRWFYELWMVENNFAESNEAKLLTNSPCLSVRKHIGQQGVCRSERASALTMLLCDEIGFAEPRDSFFCWSDAAKTHQLLFFLPNTENASVLSSD